MEVSGLQEGVDLGKWVSGKCLCLELFMPLVNGYEFYINSKLELIHYIDSNFQ